MTRAESPRAQQAQHRGPGRRAAVPRAVPRAVGAEEVTAHACMQIRSQATGCSEWDVSKRLSTLEEGAIREARSRDG